MSHHQNHYDDQHHPQQQQQQQQQRKMTTAYYSSTNPPSPPVGSIRRMTNSSQLRTFSYSGQQEQDQEQDSPSSSRPQQKQKWIHHQVYSLPIVMNEIEWERASMDDQSFVLISCPLYELFGAMKIEIFV